MTSVSLLRLQARQRRYATVGIGCMAISLAFGLAAFCFWLPWRNETGAFATILAWASADVLTLLGVPFRPSNHTWPGIAWLIGNGLVLIQSFAFIGTCIIIYKRKFRMLIWYMTATLVVGMSTSAFVDRYGADFTVTLTLPSNKNNSNSRAILPTELTLDIKADLERRQRLTKMSIVESNVERTYFAASIAKSILLQNAYIENDVERAKTLFLSLERNAEQDYGMAPWRLDIIGEWLFANEKITEDDLRAKKIGSTMINLERLGSRIAASLACAIGLFAVGPLSLAAIMFFRLRRIGLLSMLEQQAHLLRRAQKMQR
jgi:hypothetical protein